MGEGWAWKSQKATPGRAPPTRAVRSSCSEELSTCSSRPAWGPDLDPYWPSPRGQRPRRNGFCGSRVGLLGTEFQFTAGRVPRSRAPRPRGVGLARGTPPGTGWLGEGRAPGGKCSIKETKATLYRGGGSRRICFPPAPPAWITQKGAALSTCIPLSARAARLPADGGGDLKKKKKSQSQKRRPSPVDTSSGLEAHGGNGDARRDEKGGHRAATYMAA